MVPAEDIDALDLICPLPVLRLRKRLQDLPAGATVRLLASDPAAVIDVPHFCAEGGHNLLATTRRA
ncbi:MAG: sulfurtransferase TusA family protein, partial [Paracoccus sp. (in: a-proteobacteria)]|nr:sulfurtransferase TusA family protein [Paracoccus sp. (in: a-proteobacteria)]